ncbi:MAG: VWA domain-containing protein [Myxococcales bacterium]|nr:VWA domain-containing protein [Myxococcales bacterium]
MKEALFSILALAAASTAACSEPPIRLGAGDGGNTMDGGTMGTDSGVQLSDSSTSADRNPMMILPDAGCATQNTPTTRAPISLLLVVDRSGSMNECSDGSSSGSCRVGTKWSVTQGALVRLLRSLENEARVGLMFFPALSGGSTADGYRMPVIGVDQPLSMTRDMLISRIEGTSASGNTPMACAMPQAVDYMRNQMTSFSKNILLITDGAPTDECSGTMCNPFDITCVLNASMAAQNVIVGAVARGGRTMPPVRTFALGTPDAVPSFMSQIAVNGVTQRTPGCGPNDCHYTLGTATFERDLNMALDAVRGRAQTCEFMLQVDPMRADPNLINVYYTPTSGGMGRFIPRDTSHMNGWDYTAGGRSIVFYGMICDEVLMGSSGSSVQIIYGCPTIIPG